MYIQKQANGTYRVWVRRRGRSTSSTFDRKADAEAFGRKIEAAIEAGASVEYKKIKSSTLADLLNHYQTHVIPTRRNPTQEKQRIKHWLATSLAKRPLDSLAAIDFARYRDSRKRAGRADNTIRLELALVGRIFNLARMEWGFVGLNNPIADIQKPGGSQGRERRLLAGEFFCLYKRLRRVDNPWAGYAFALAIETTLRQATLMSLKWSWIDLSRRVIRIPVSARTAENKGVPASLPLTKRAVKILKMLGKIKIGNDVFGCSANAVVCVWKRTKAEARRDYENGCIEAGITHTGILVDIQIPDKQNNLNSLANEAANTLNTGTGSAGNLVDMATGLGPAGGGIIVGILSTLLESYAKSTPRTLPQLLIKQPDGEIISLGIEPHHLRDSIDFNCIQIGDPIKIIHDGYRPNYLNGDTRLQRKVFVEPS